jgi:GT2 family glycosyltransferase
MERIEKPAVYILLPVYNRKHITLKLVECLLKQTYTHYFLVLIDDGSTDGTSEAVLQRMPQAIVIRGEGKWWWAGSLQQGYHWVKKNGQENGLVIIVNDDSWFDPDFIETGVRLMTQTTRTFILSTGVNGQTGVITDIGVHYDFSKNEPRMTDKAAEINCLSTRGLFMHVKDFISTGGFYPRLLPHYLSDYEFTMRAHRKGIRLTCAKELKLYYNPETTGFLSVEERTFILFFSRKNMENPFYFSNFYFLAYPFPYNLKYSMQALYKAVKDGVGIIKHRWKGRAQK